MKLLFRTAEWHALAKLRLHTESTLAHLERLTTDLGKLMREFRDSTCSAFDTVELPRELDARNRHSHKKQNTKQTGAAPQAGNAIFLKFQALSNTKLQSLP